MNCASAALALLAALLAARAQTPTRLGYFHGGRTNMVYRAYIHGCLDEGAAPVALLTHRLRSKSYFTIAKDEWLESGMGEGKVSGVELVDAIASGTFDGGMIGEASFIDAVRRRLPITAVALLGHQTRGHPGHALIVRRDLVIRSPRDFRGKTLISRRAGPMDEALLRAFVAAQGLVPGKDVRILPQVDEDDSVSLLASGKIDGGFYHLLLGELVVRRGFGRIYRPMDWADPEMLQAVLVFNDEFLRHHPERAQRIVSGYIARIGAERRLPESARDRSGMTGMMMEESFRGLTIPTYDSVPFVRVGLLDEAQRLLVAYGGQPRLVDLRPWIDNGFVARAAAEGDGEGAARLCSAHPRTPFQDALALTIPAFDAAAFDALRRQGRLPHLSRLLERGALWLGPGAAPDAAPPCPAAPEVASSTAPAEGIEAALSSEGARRFCVSAALDSAGPQDGLLALDAALGRARRALKAARLSRQTLIYAAARDGSALITDDPAVDRPLAGPGALAATLADRFGAPSPGPGRSSLSAR